MERLDRGQVEALTKVAFVADAAKTGSPDKAPLSVVPMYGYGITRRAMPSISSLGFPFNWSLL